MLCSATAVAPGLSFRKPPVSLRFSGSQKDNDQTTQSLSIGFPKPGEVGYYRFTETGPPGQTQFDILTSNSGVSTGTELTELTGRNPRLNKIWDETLRLFLPRRRQRKTPVSKKDTGYMEVGRVTRVGQPAQVGGGLDTQDRGPLAKDRVSEGDVVCMAYGHKTSHRGDISARFVKLPESFANDPKLEMLGIFAAQMGPICANAIAHADAYMQFDDFLAQKAELLAKSPELPTDDIQALAAPLLRTDQLGASLKGKKVAIYGAGVVGLMTAMMAKEAGAAEVVMVDRLPDRLKLARKLGFTAIKSSQFRDPAKVIKQHLWNGEDPGADIVFECTGNYKALNDAIRTARQKRKVIAVGFYQGEGNGLRLGEEFHHNGISVVCAQVGHNMPGWDRLRLSQETVNMLVNSDYIRWGASRLITHVVPYSQAPKVYQALRDENESLIHEHAVNRGSHDMLQIVLQPDPQPVTDQLLKDARKA